MTNLIAIAYNYKRAPEMIPTGKIAAIASAFNMRPWEQEEAAG